MFTYSQETSKKCLVAKVYTLASLHLCVVDGAFANTLAPWLEFALVIRYMGLNRHQEVMN